MSVRQLTSWLLSCPLSQLKRNVRTKPLTNISIPSFGPKEMITFQCRPNNNIPMAPFLTKVMDLYSNAALSDKGDGSVFQCHPFWQRGWICILMPHFLTKLWICIPMPPFLTKVMNTYSNAALSDKGDEYVFRCRLLKGRFQSHAFHTQRQSSTYSCQTNCEEHASSLDHPFDGSGESANEAPLKKAMNIPMPLFGACLRCCLDRRRWEKNGQRRGQDDVFLEEL